MIIYGKIRCQRENLCIICAIHTVAAAITGHKSMVLIFISLSAFGKKANSGGQDQAAWDENYLNSNLGMLTSAYKAFNRNVLAYECRRRRGKLPHRYTTQSTYSSRSCCCKITIYMHLLIASPSTELQFNHNNNNKWEEWHKSQWTGLDKRNYNNVSHLQIAIVKRIKNSLCRF